MIRKMSALPEFRLDDIVENPLGNARVCHQTRYMREPLAYVVCGDGC
jgi:hypothetical protein